jgi:hypothetical protein
MMVDVTIANGTDTPLKDIELTCTSSAPSGTVIDRNVRTIYEIVKTKRRFRDFSMGFIAHQATRTSCEITDLALVGVGTEVPAIRINVRRHVTMQVVAKRP